MTDCTVPDAYTNTNAALKRVLVATTNLIDISKDLLPGMEIDDVILKSGDRVLVKDQIIVVENGIRVIQPDGPPQRCSSLVDVKYPQLLVFVKSGTRNQDSHWICRRLNSFIANRLWDLKFERCVIPD